MFHYIFRAISEFILLQGRRKFAYIIIGIIITTIITTIEPFFMARVIGYLEIYYHTRHFPQDEFLTFLLVWIAYIVVSLLASYVHRYFLSDKPALVFHNQIAYKYINHVYYMSMGAYLQKKTGSIYKNFDRGMTAHFLVIFLIFKDWLRTIISLVLVLIYLIITSPIMTLLSLSMLPFMALSGFFVYKKTHEPQKENVKRWTKAFGHIGNFMTNFQLWKILLLERNFLNKFHHELDIALTQQKLTSKWWAVNDMITTVFVMISRFLVLGYGVYAVTDGRMSLAQMMLVLSLISMIYYPIGYLFGSFGDIQKKAADLEQFYQEFESVDLEKDESGKVLKSVTWSIEFKDVSFGYTDERSILKNISFCIAPWEKIALVGNTGAGKSTIVSLLFRFWDPTTGEICIDDVNVDHYKKSSLRRHFWLVAQDNSLFNLSIRENLLFAKKDASETELISALKKASADFVFSLENWLDTIIGERGLKLSGGEKQRLSIARLFLQDPQILVLDEATSALDNNTEKKIQQSLDELIQWKTAIIIAHRLSTIKDADRIFVVDDGKIVEIGTYDALMKQGGKFAKLADPDTLLLTT